jgi:hypothetical protein
LEIEEGRGEAGLEFNQFSYIATSAGTILWTRIGKFILGDKLRCKIVKAIPVELALGNWERGLYLQTCSKRATMLKQFRKITGVFHRAGV